MTNAAQRGRERRAMAHPRGGGSKRHHLMRVVAPHFVAGLVLDSGGRCVETAPILAASIGKSEAELRAYFARRGWQVELVS